MQQQLAVGQRVNFTSGNFTCKKCGDVICENNGIKAVVGGFDGSKTVYHLDKPITCQHCGTVNDACWRGCIGAGDRAAAARD